MNGIYMIGSICGWVVTCCTYEGVMSHMSHVNESGPKAASYVHEWAESPYEMCHFLCEGFTSHMFRMNESYEWVMSQTSFVDTWMRRVAYEFVPCPMWSSHITHIPYECVIWMRQTYMNETYVHTHTHTYTHTHTHTPCHIWTHHVSHSHARTGSSSCECTRAGLDMCLMTHSHFTYLYLKSKPPVEGRSVLPPQNLVTLGAQVCKSLLQVSFIGLFYRSLLQVFFAGLFCRFLSI